MRLAGLPSRALAALALPAVIFLFVAGCGDDKKTNPEPTGSWEVVGAEGLSTGEATQVVLCVDAGVPYVAFIDYGEQEKVVVKKFDGSSWVQLGDSGSPRFRTSVSMFVFQGVPYLTYDAGSAFVIKYVNNEWAWVGGSASSVAAGRPVVFVAGGIVYLAYADHDLDNRLTVKKFVDPSWVTVGTEGFSEGEFDLPSLFVDGDTPYVVFRDYAHPLHTTVMKYDGSWTSLGGAGVLAGEPGSRGLAVDDGIPYVFYSKLSGGQANVVKFVGGAWVNVGAADFSEGGAWYGSLVLSGAAPYVAFQDEANGGKATVMKFSDGEWKAVGDPHFTASSVQFTSLQVSDNIPYVAFKDYTTKKVTVMRWVPD